MEPGRSAKKPNLLRKGGSNGESRKDGRGEQRYFVTFSSKRVVISFSVECTSFQTKNVIEGEVEE